MSEATPLPAHRDFVFRHDDITEELEHLLTFVRERKPKQVYAVRLYYFRSVMGQRDADQTLEVGAYI